MTAQFRPDIPRRLIAEVRGFTNFTGVPIVLICEEDLLLLTSVGVWYRPWSSEKVHHLTLDEASFEFDSTLLGSEGWPPRLIVSNGKDLRWVFRHRKCGYVDQEKAAVDFQKIVSALERMREKTQGTRFAGESITIRAVEFDEASDSYWLEIRDSSGVPYGEEIEWYRQFPLRELLGSLGFQDEEPLTIESEDHELLQKILAEPMLGK